MVLALRTLVNAPNVITRSQGDYSIPKCSKYIIFPRNMAYSIPSFSISIFPWNSRISDISFISMDSRTF